MITQTAAKSNIPTISGFRFYYNKLDFSQKAALREYLGNPQNSTFYGWLDDPGSMRLDKVGAALRYLETLFPGISTKDLLKEF